jgi:hypothetical protein
MRDILFLAVAIGFFAIAVVFVRACELIIGTEKDRER